MVLHHSQDVFQIAERIQVIRFRCFCDAVDDRTGFRAVDTVDQLPCMFVQAEAAQRAFRCVIIKRDFTVTKEYFSCLFLVDAVVDPFQGFTFDQTAGFLGLFYPRKESLHQRFEVDLPLFSAVVRFQISKLVVQMIDRTNPLDRFIGDRFFLAASCSFFDSAFRASAKYLLAWVQHPAKTMASVSRSSFR